MGHVGKTVTQNVVSGSEITDGTVTGDDSASNIAISTSGVADDDFLRVNGTNIEGRSASEVATDIGAVSAGFAIAMSVAL